MAANQLRMSRVWRTIKDFDIDKSGHLGVEELAGCFWEHFAPELQGKSLVYFFRRYGTEQNKDIIDYRQVKNIIMDIVRQNKPMISTARITEYSNQSNLMRRSGTVANINSGQKIRQELGLASERKLGVFDSYGYMNKPVKAD